MKAFITILVKRPIAVYMFYACVVLFGVIAMGRLKLSLLPDIELPVITVTSRFPEASPEEIENLITKPITESIGGVNGLEKMQSESSEGLSEVKLRFSHKVKTDFAIMEIRERLDAIRSALPQDAERPMVARYDPSASPFMEIVFYPTERFTIYTLKNALIKNIKTHLERSDGVASVQFSGGYTKEIRIRADYSRLRSYGITPADIRHSVMTAGVNIPAGSVPSGMKDIPLRTFNEFHTVDEIKNSRVISSSTGAAVFISDIADVRQGWKEKTEEARYNGKEVIIARLYRESGKNTVETSENLKKELDSILRNSGEDYKAEIVFDESIFIKDSIAGLTQSLISGCILAFIALILLIRNWKSPLVLLGTVPVSLLLTYLFFFFFGISLNMLSLGGLALGIGMLFDTGNVILSAIERNLNRGMPPVEASIHGTEEVSASVVSAVLTTLIVFLPIPFIKSIAGLVFSEMALAVSISLCASLMVSLTLIPVITSVLYKDGNHSRNTNQLFVKLETIHKKMLREYETKLTKVLIRPYKTILISILLFIGTLLFLPLVRKEFVPDVDSGEFTIEAETSSALPLSYSEGMISEIEKYLLQEKNISGVISWISKTGQDGSSNRKKSLNGGSISEVRVILNKNRNISSDEFINKIKYKFQFSKDVSLRFHKSGDVLSTLLESGGKGVELEISGEEDLVLEKYGNELISRLEKIKGLSNVRSSHTGKMKVYSAKPDLKKLSQSGITPQELGGLLKISNIGENSIRAKLPDGDINIRIGIFAWNTPSREELLKLGIRTKEGRQISLSEIVEMKEEKVNRSIYRTHSSRVARITAESSINSDTNQQIEGIIHSIKLPEGYKIRWGGEKEEQEKSFKDLLFSLILAFILICMLLAAQFESLKIAGVTLLTIPIMFTGIFPTLWIADKGLNVSSFIGLILLLGIVVDNASLFYEYLETLSKEGMSHQKTIIDTGRIIFRPVLMNSGTTILGLLPVILQIGSGTEFQSPMAWTVCIGLISSFYFTLYLVPSVFYIYLKR